MRKGVSPIVASVLLLAVTLSVASIFSGWGPNIVRTVTQSTQNQTETTINCNQASVDITSAKYYTGDNTSVVVRNTGTSDLDQLQISTWKNDLPMNQKVISVNRGNFTTVNVSTSSKPDSVQAFSKDCSSVTDKYEQIS
ncbi:MAG: archaellin/type IV pilin N-terminal domain-containing protein [Candidatus Nanohaloarchaea archaeon]